jgi:chromosome segregation ATPase
MTVAEVDKVSELMERLDALRATRSTLENQRARANRALEDVAGRRAVFTKALADGDTKAAQKLDALDVEERGHLRTLEGVEINLASNAAETQPLAAELARESALEAARERKRQFEAKTQRAEARLRKVEALESELTAEFTELHAELADLSQNFYDLSGGNAASRIADGLFFHTRRVNEGWNFSPQVFGMNKTLVIRPMIPPKR